jgi:outer membrane protein assembly factor BamD
MAFVRNRARLIAARCICALALAVVAAACASEPKRPPVGVEEPDKFLWEHGTRALNERRWFVAREFFRQLMDSYPQSPYRADAKLGISDSFLGEGSAESQVLAINEYSEFLSYYPTHERAHYAQFKLGMAHFRQMRSPQRDQTETRSAVRDFEAFVQRYPSSSLMPEVNAKLREARDNLGTWELEVGRHYLRIHWYPGAIDRLMTLLKQDPEYTRRDAVYFYLGESLIKAKRESEALPYLERLVEEFEKSEYLDEARKRIATLKMQAQGTTSS